MLRKNLIDDFKNVIYNCNIMIEEKSLYAATELAKLLGVTRQEVIRRIWRGFIKAQKVGNQYIITKKEALRVIAEGRKK